MAVAGLLLLARVEEECLLALPTQPLEKLSNGALSPRPPPLPSSSGVDGSGVGRGRRLSRRRAAAAAPPPLLLVLLLLLRLGGTSIESSSGGDSGVVPPCSVSLSTMDKNIGLSFEKAPMKAPLLPLPAARS